GEERAPVCRAAAEERQRAAQALHVPLGGLAVLRCPRREEARDRVQVRKRKTPRYRYRAHIRGRGENGSSASDSALRIARTDRFVVLGLRHKRDLRPVVRRGRGGRERRGRERW